MGDPTFDGLMGIAVILVLGWIILKVLGGLFKLIALFILGMFGLALLGGGMTCHRVAQQSIISSSPP